MLCVTFGHIENDQLIRIVLTVIICQTDGIRIHDGGIRKIPHRMLMI